MLKILMLFLVALFSGTSDEVVSLEADSLPTGWQQSGEVREFRGGALYQHINGGSEVYLEHGFQTLFVQDLIHDSGEEVRLEFYVMADARGARAMIEMNTRGLETDQRFGDLSSVDPYQILFISGRYYVSITAYSEDELVGAAMELLAEQSHNYLCSLE